MEKSEKEDSNFIKLIKAEPIEVYQIIINYNFIKLKKSKTKDIEKHIVFYNPIDETIRSETLNISSKVIYNEALKLIKDIKNSKEVVSTC